MKRKNQSGAVVVEAAIVVTVVTMFIAVMLYIGMVLYQQSLVNIMANQTASNIAQIYGNTLRDPFTGYIDADGVHETVTYTNLRNDAYKNVIEQKANAAALYRLKSSKILTTGDPEVEVQVVPKKNELLKDQIVVTVTDTYKLPLVSFFGIKNSQLTFTGVGRADCTDLLEYLSGVPALGTNDGNAVAFSENECTVNFYKHYGDIRPLKTVTVLRGNSVVGSSDYSHSSMPEKPTQDKMRFTKWIKENGSVFTGDSIVNENLNVYGNWECTVKFDPDGGKVSINPPEMTATVTGNILLPTAEKQGCTFAGWYTKKNGEGEEFTGIDVKGDITVYAKWICTVSLNADGGTASPDQIDVICGKSIADMGLSLPTPTRSDCTFGGWFTKRSGEGSQITNSSKIKEHTTLVAKWSCTVTLNANGGTVKNGSITAIIGKKIDLPTPDRAHKDSKGWQFDNWFENSNLTGKNFKAEKQIYTVENPITLYAKWHCNHDINYNDAVRQTVATRCTEQNTTTYKCKYCTHEQTVYGARGECRNGHCGFKHYYGNGTYEKWGPWAAHPGECPQVYWYSHWVCPDCGVFGSTICGSCDIWYKSWNWINTHACGWSQGLN